MHGVNALHNRRILFLTIGFSLNTSGKGEKVDGVYYGEYKSMRYGRSTLSSRGACEKDDKTILFL